jgi:hypothetical protein
MENYGTVKVGKPIVKSEFNEYTNIYKYMEANGFNVKACDICNIESEYSEGKCDVKFKFVHYSVRSASSEPYRCITFVE